MMLKTMVKQGSSVHLRSYEKMAIKSYFLSVMAGYFITKNFVMTYD